MKRVLKKTLDNSYTIFVPEFNEHFHSVNGAVSESIHVFIRNGLDFIRNSGLVGQGHAISILEVGLGTGLNVCLTHQHSNDLQIEYTALEPFPLDEPVWRALNYEEWINMGIFTSVHESEWGIRNRMTAGLSLSLMKLKTTLQDFNSTEKFDLIYFDAFAPAVQPEIWDEETFTKLFHNTNDGGALVTYCAKGSVKRALSSSGFTVETLPGAAGKREMVRAVKEKRWYLKEKPPL